MQPDQASTVLQFLLPAIEREHQTTVKVLAAVSERQIGLSAGPALRDCGKTGVANRLERTVFHDRRGRRSVPGWQRHVGANEDDRRDRGLVQGAESFHGVMYADGCVSAVNDESLGPPPGAALGVSAADWSEGAGDLWYERRRESV